MIIEYNENHSRSQDLHYEWRDTLSGVPIVIDNGSYECRAGYADDNSPHMIFRNVVFRPRMAKGILVGNDISNLNAVRHSLKSPFMENLVTNLEVQETILDHIFDRLSIAGSTKNHPIIINEVFNNPSVCRAQLTELLFETYNVPKLAYYVDGLASYYENVHNGSISDSTSNCLIISLGHQTTHIVPLLRNDSMDPSSLKSMPNLFMPAARRLHTGGAHVSWLLQRLLQLKYPSHSEQVTTGLAEYLIHNHGFITTNYREKMKNWYDDSYKLSHGLKVQLSFTQPTTEDIKALADRKRAQTERLLNVHRKRQQQQLESTQQRLNDLLSADQLIKRGDTGGNSNAPIKQTLSKLGLSNINQFNQEIINCQQAISRLQTQLNSSKDGSAKKSSNSNGSPQSVNLEIEDESDDSDKSQMMTDPASEKLSELTGRRKRAAELLASQSVPSAVQSQMIAAPAPIDTKFTEAKLRMRMKMAHELESTRTDDFVVWLNTLRHRRAFISKRRTQRQSRIDLATQIGLHNTDKNLNGSTSSGENIQQTKQNSTNPSSTISMGQSTANIMVTTDDNKYRDSKRAMTERRRMQLEKIRAMAAELKPSRSRGRGSHRGNRVATNASSRGQSKPNGRGAVRSETVGRPRLSNAELDLEPDDVDNLAEENADLMNLDDPMDVETGIPTLWDPDTEDANEDSNSMATKKTTNPLLSDSNPDPGDESENERDQLAVLDSVLALYDPEAHKDLGISDLKVNLSLFHQLHVDTEIPRSCEVLFQPSFLGNPEAGLGDTMEFVLRDISRASNNSVEPASYLPKFIFLTGSLCSLVGLRERIYTEIRPLLPFGAEWDDVQIVVAKNPSLDAWQGARRWAATAQDSDFITPRLYDEVGPHYLAEHILSNPSYCSKRSNNH